MNIQNINFKKVAIAFVALFLIFAIVSATVELANGRWGEAVSYEQYRFENSQNNRRFGGRQGGDRRHGRSHRHQSTYIAVEQVADSYELHAPTRTTGDRIVFSLARHYVRVTSFELNVLNVFGVLLHLAFFAIITLWVYVDSKKREYNAFVWASITLFFHIFGLIGYIIFREVKRIHSRRLVT